MGVADLARHLSAVTVPPPCDGCYFRDLCFEQEMACREFRRYIRGKEDGKGYDGPKFPSREIYDRAFCEVDAPESGAERAEWHREIRRILYRLDLTPAQLADKIGSTPGTVETWIRPRTYVTPEPVMMARMRKLYELCA